MSASPVDAASRRRPARSLGAALLSAAATLLLAGCSHEEPAAIERPAAAPAPLPDVVFYLVDTLRTDALGAYGSERGDSPALDAFAGQAAVFEQAYTQAPWTLPSVTTINTSTYPPSHRVLSFSERVGPQVQTLTEYMQSRGYHTVGFVANTNGGRGAGLDQGFDEFTDHKVVSDAARDSASKPGNLMQSLFDWAAADHGDKPLFLYVHTIEPHQPYEGYVPAQPGRFTGDKEENGRLMQLMQDQRKLMAALNTGTLDAPGSRRLEELSARLAGRLPDLHDLYGGDVRQADRNFGHLVQLLGRRPRWKDTVVLFVSDHGEEFLEHGGWFHGQSVYQELLHVPFLLRLPGRTDAGLRIDAEVGLVDVLPTLADIVGGPRMPDWQGRSLLPLLRGETLDPQPVYSMRIITEDNQKALGDRGETETALIDGNWKLIVHHDVNRMSLFDLATDPGERHDLSAEQPERARTMLQAVQKRLSGLPVLAYRSTEALDASAEAQKLQHLEELGYVERARDR